MRWYPTVYLKLMDGLGDTIYSRPYAQALVEYAETLFIETSWPQLFSDLPNVKFVKPQGLALRVQRENVASWHDWHKPLLEYGKTIILSYGPAHLREGSIIERFDTQLRIRNDRSWTLPAGLANVPQLVTGGRPLAIVRPVTARKEWLNLARNPRPVYVNEIARELLETHYVVSLASVAPGKEWLLGSAPPAHLQLHRGELSILQALELTRHADIVVGGVGWIVPAALATGTKTFIVLGGQGGYNAPNKLVPPNTFNVGWAIPDNFCLCTQMQHTCDKTIEGSVVERFRAWRRIVEQSI